MKRIFLAAAFLLGATTAHSAVLDYRFTAVLQSATLDDGVSSVVDSAAALAMVTGRLTLDLTLDPSQSTSVANAYGPATLTVDQLTLGTAGAFALPQSPFFVSNDNPVRNEDLMALGVAGPAVVAYPDDGIVESFGMGFIDPTQTALGSNDFPSLIVLSDWAEATLVIRGEERVGGVSTGNSEFARFTLTELAPVPLPAGLPLLLAGLGGLALLRRRRG